MKSDDNIHHEILNDVKREVSNHDKHNDIKHYDKNHLVRHDKLSHRHHNNHEHHKHQNFKENKNLILKKGLILLFSIFMVFLMISFVFVSYPILDIIKSKDVASDASTNILEFNDGYKVVFENDTFQGLRENYKEKSALEFVICMKGSFNNKTYLIESFYEPEIYSRTFNHVSFESCDNESLVLLHSHPHKHCVASNTDINTLRKMQEVNKETLMMVMCEFDRISVYR